MKPFTVLYIAALFLTATGCKKEELTPVPVTDIIVFTDGHATELPADGASTVVITVELNDRTDTAIHEVEFTTTAGTFPNGSGTERVAIDSYRNARIVLTAGSTPGPVHITAAVAGVSIIRDMTFVEARPDDVLMTLSETYVDSSSTASVRVSVALFRDTGVPNAGQRVSFSYTADQGVSYLVLPALAFSDSAGECSVELFNPLQRAGTVEITSAVVGQAGDTLRTSSMVFYH